MGLRLRGPQRRQPFFLDFGHDANVAVGNFVDGVFYSSTKDLRDLGRRELEVLLKPLPQARRGAAQSLVERAGQAHGHDLRGRFDARSVHPRASD